MIVFAFCRIFAGQFGWVLFLGAQVFTDLAWDVKRDKTRCEYQGTVFPLELFSFL